MSLFRNTVTKTVRARARGRHPSVPCGVTKGALRNQGPGLTSPDSPATVSNMFKTTRTLSSAQLPSILSPAISNTAAVQFASASRHSALVSAASRRIRHEVLERAAGLAEFGPWWLKAPAFPLGTRFTCASKLRCVAAVPALDRHAA